MSILRTRVRAGIVVLALIAALLVGPAGVGRAGAAKGPGNAKVPPEVIARVAVLQQVLGGFTISPVAGPVGTIITFTGNCGFPAEEVSLSLDIETEPGFNQIVAIHLFEPIAWSAHGSFSVTLEVPATRLDGEPVYAAVHRAFAACDLLKPTERRFAPRTFTVTGS